MEISFFLNWMGVLNMDFYKDNNIPYTEVTKYSKLLDKEYTVKQYHQTYSCGRIDIYGVPDEPFGTAYGVSPMEDESWGKLGEWLDKITLNYIPTEEELYRMFENDTGYKIKWWRDNE